MGQLKHRGPVANWLEFLIGWVFNKVFGWQEVALDDAPEKAVFIAHPHTSAWDLPMMLGCAWSLRVKLSWMGKKETFRFPFRRFFLALGGVPVDRQDPRDTVEQIADVFRERDRMYLAIAPSGTRAKRERWKSGFYRIALAANVPIVCGFLDFPKRRGGIGRVVHPTGDIEADMNKIREFYEGIEGKYPDKHTAILLDAEKHGFGARASAK